MVQEASDRQACCPTTRMQLPENLGVQGFKAGLLMHFGTATGDFQYPCLFTRWYMMVLLCFSFINNSLLALWIELDLTGLPPLFDHRTVG